MEYEEGFDEIHIPFTKSPLDAYRGAGGPGAKPRHSPKEKASKADVEAKPPNPPPAKKKPGRKKKPYTPIRFIEEPITLKFD